MVVVRLRAWGLALAPTVVYNLGLMAVLRLMPGPGVGLRDRTAWVLGGGLVVELVVLGGVLAWLRWGRESLAELGWGRPVRPGAVVAAVVAALVYAGFTLSSPVFAAPVLELSLFKAWGALVGVVGGAVEELVFRGFVIRQLEQAGLGSVGQVAGAAALFGLIHGGAGLLWGRLFLLPGILITTLLGLALGWLYMAGGRSLTAPMVCHGLINLLIEPWLMMGTVSLGSRGF